MTRQPYDTGTRVLLWVAGLALAAFTVLFVVLILGDTP